MLWPFWKISQPRVSCEDRLGTVVETLAPGVFEVEFSDNDGRTYASVALKANQLLLLHHEFVHAA